MYRVVYEIEVDADSPLEAARMVEDSLQDPDRISSQFYIQSEDNPQVYSVDLNEEARDAVLAVPSYIPLIKSGFNLDRSERIVVKGALTKYQQYLKGVDFGSFRGKFKAHYLTIVNNLLNKLKSLK